MASRIRTTWPVVVLVSIVPLSAGAEAPAAHVRNFDRVNDHLFRGGEPSLVGLQELGAMGVKIDIDLREAGEGIEIEKRGAEKLGMKYVSVPMNAFSAPSKEQVERVLSLLLQNDTATIYVHCRRGKDRTGTVIACYRIQHDRWDNRRALAEARRHGMSFVERGMQAYILHFAPIPFPPAPVPVAATH